MVFLFFTAVIIRVLITCICTFCLFWLYFSTFSFVLSCPWRQRILRLRSRTWRFWAPEGAVVSSPSVIVHLLSVSRDLFFTVKYSNNKSVPLLCGNTTIITSNIFYLLSHDSSWLHSFIEELRFQCYSQNLIKCKDSRVMRQCMFLWLLLVVFNKGCDDQTFLINVSYV